MLETKIRQIGYKLCFQFQLAPLTQGCVDAVYPILEMDSLQIRVVPGTPFKMGFTTAPPAVNENDYYLDPAPSIEVRDVAGNLCTELNTFMTVDVEPRTARLHGNVAPLTGGTGSFPALRFSGQRGKSYKLIFHVHAHGLTLEYAPFTISNCETVKPNSYADAYGKD